ncbi:MAG: hypothetical protein ACXVWU_09275 [Nocardioides sp.]
MRPVTRAAAGLLAAALVSGGLSSCESSEQKAAEHAMAKAADLTTCRADATAAPTPYPAGFPGGWPFPPRTTVFGAEDRGADGTVVSAITSTPFKDVLAFMNGRVAGGGFKVVKGETEEHDAEAEWSGNGFHGRWAIRESASCDGETVIQVLSAKS